MLNGKQSFDIPNVPPEHVLVRFNVLFAYLFEAVSGGKGLMHLKIEPSKKQTICNLLQATFPAIKCYDFEELHVINPRIVAYIHALVIDSITTAFADSINSRALEHESAMVDVYSKMKPDGFRSQLQTVLTAYYEDIKGVASASGSAKTKVVKRKFEDQDGTDLAPGAAGAAGVAGDAAADADTAAAATPATPPDESAATAPGGAEPPLAPSPARGGGSKGRGQPGGAKKSAGKASG
jgi:hypothetical protein